MLVLAVFTAIGAAAVLLMLRFLIALETEIRSARARSASVERVPIYFRISSEAGVQGPARGLTLVHGNAFPQRRESSWYKHA